MEVEIIEAGATKTKARLDVTIGVKIDVDEIIEKTIIYAVYVDKIIAKAGAISYINM